MRVIGYTRVSTEDQATSGLGLAAQRDVIGREAERRGWEVTWVADEGFSAKSLQRPGVTDALGRLSAGDAKALVVSKLDRLSRSIHDFAGVMQLARREGWALVCLDLGVDTTTPTGTLMANVFASFAQFERELIGQRTSDALQALRWRGKRLGRPSRIPPDVMDRIVAERAAGATLTAIADRLNDEAVATASGSGRWWASTIRSALLTRARDREAAALRAQAA